MRIRVLLLLIFLILVVECNKKRLDLSLYLHILNGTKAIIFMPIRSNFELPNIQRYILNQRSMEYIALHSPYVVLNRYNMKSDCRLKEIFICSDLRDTISRYGVEPSQTLFIEYSIIEETNMVMAEISSKSGSSGGKTMNSGMRYKFIVKGYNYREESPIFEDRYEFSPDLESSDVFSPIYKQLYQFLGDFLDSLNDINKIQKQDTNIEYYINHFQYFYDSNAGAEGFCKTKGLSTDKEIDGELFFQGYYSNISVADINSMKYFSCGVLIKKFDQPFFREIGMEEGDLIVNFCGNIVYGYHSINNAVLADFCNKNNKIVVFRNSEPIELSFKRRAFK